MALAVKKTISFPPDLVREVEETAANEGKTFSAVVQDAIRIARRERLKKEFGQIQDVWSKKARDLGLLKESDLDAFLKK